jgi:hypothetical protein
MDIDHHVRRWVPGWLPIASFAVVLAVAAITATATLARPAVAPQNTAVPKISGPAKEGSTLTADNGTWTNAPTGYAYQWLRCDRGGATCANITGATSKTYSVATADVDNTLRVEVTATNADGQAVARSSQTAVVSSSKGPTNTVAPAISGNAQVGDELSVSTGTWTGGVQSFFYQWQRCDASGASCANVVDATARTYGVRTLDAGNTLRAVVTAKNGSGTTSATSGPSAVVKGAGGGTTTTTTTVAGNKAPTVVFVSLRRLGTRVYARFRVCDDSSKAVSVIERDSKPGVAAYSRRFSIVPVPCGTHAKSWLLIPRFRHGRYTASLHAVDKSGRSSRTVSRTLRFP